MSRGRLGFARQARAPAEKTYYVKNGRLDRIHETPRTWELPGADWSQETAMGVWSSGYASPNTVRVGSQSRAATCCPAGDGGISRSMAAAGERHICIWALTAGDP